MAPLAVRVVPTTPFADQKPGTSGLRKKVTVFQAPHYTENFVQAVIEAIPPEQRKVLVVGGDGRYFVKDAAQVILRIAAANGFAHIVVGHNALLSTPAVSCIVRKRHATGAIILTASHNPGGPTADFGIKYNASNGGPAPESVTNQIFAISKGLREYRLADFSRPIDLGAIGTVDVDGVRIEVIDSVADYVEMVQGIFDFTQLRTFVQKQGAAFKVLIDSMHGVTGPYSRRIFVDELGLPATSVMNAVPSEDFHGGHPDPNLTYAKELVDRVQAERVDFAAAFDGDGDRNMILGYNSFVNPSDSVAIIAANALAVPYFRQHGIKGLARSMPTSSALDKVAHQLKVDLYEVPTGWKFFGNLMDAGRLSICGEESFGTGSDHIREKDGLWAVLAWLSILAQRAADGKDFALGAIQRDHFAQYGRNYFTRYDYEEVASAGADAMMAALRAHAAQGTLTGKVFEEAGETYTVGKVDDFAYTDPIDASVSTQQGLRVLFTDGSRFVFRLSGTGSVGATVRLYVEKYQADASKSQEDPQTALGALVRIALRVSELPQHLQRDAPTVIT
eukprot:Unigene7875_Nuclearia_a/m.24189 Unigene7875_Nuclearia_a/g.24189  ORF Unigene7875_Nuclearia_a/g.24189 Unigene7875_Nuclearia_a/m.24189 type:complete len:562 (+) Unigene7875_Nuclearia_a:47-1732(+)